MKTFRVSRGLLALLFKAMSGLALVDCHAQVGEFVAISDLNHEFRFVKRELPASDVDACEFNAVEMALKIRPTKCVGFKCTRTRIDLHPIIEPLTIHEAALLVFDEAGTASAITGSTVGLRHDDDLNVMCPEIGLRDLILLRFPLNKRGLASALGHVETRITKPFAAKLAIGLELFSFEGGVLKSIGHLVSEPLFVRITEGNFEISSIPFPENAAEKTH